MFDGEVFRRGRVDLRKRQFFLPDFPFVFGNVTVLRHIGMVLRLYGADGGADTERILALLKGFDLMTVADTLLSKLSRGQLYKAALVALMAVDPEVWLLDEPFASGMDPNGISFFKREAREAARRGRTVIYSTQILDIAENLSNHVCLIHKGELRVFETFANLHSRALDKDSVLEELFQGLREELQ